MATIDRSEGEEYSVTYGIADISKIANEIKTVPADYINEAGNGITEKGIAYLKPLIVGETEVKYELGLPKHVSID